MTREEAREQLKLWLNYLYPDTDIYHAVTMAIVALKKQKTGKWIVKEKGLKVTIYECSECKRHVMDDTGYDVVKDYPYCHCGARMVGAEE